MGGGTIRQGYPSPNPTISYWQLPPHRLADHHSTPDLPQTNFDYVIIGSGITGAATAYKLLTRDPTLSILMLEARTAASGASGRNGGHCRAGWWTNFQHYSEKFGEDEALKFERLEEQNIQDIADFVKEHQVDCDFKNVETASVFVTETQWAKTVDAVEYREKVRQRRPDAGPLTKRKVLHGEEARTVMGMPLICGAVTFPAHTQNPYLLVCKMLELCLEKGLNLQTETVAERLIQTEGTKGWTTVTERGNVHSTRVVLATNGYTFPLYPELAKTEFIWPGRSQISAIRPQNDISNNPAFQRSAGLDDFGASGDYFLARADGLKGAGDIIYGGGRSVSETREKGITDDSVIHPGIAKYLKEAPPKFFGHKTWGEKSEEIRDWSGITCYTSDSFPLVGEAPGKQGLWCSIGMNGHGMAMAFRCAEGLVEMMVNGREPEWFPKPFRIARAWEK